LLHGAKFTICTDHKALEYIQTQKHLSPRQHRWADALPDSDFIKYIPGETNTFADALLRIYSSESVGTVRAPGEYVTDDSEMSTSQAQVHLNNIELPYPLYTGAVASADLDNELPAEQIATRPRRVILKLPRQPDENPTAPTTTPDSAPAASPEDEIETSTGPRLTDVITMGTPENTAILNWRMT